MSQLIVNREIFHRLWNFSWNFSPFTISCNHYDKKKTLWYFNSTYVFILYLCYSRLSKQLHVAHPTTYFNTQFQNGENGVHYTGMDFACDAVVLIPFKIELTFIFCFLWVRRFGNTIYATAGMCSFLFNYQNYFYVLLHYFSTLPPMYIACLCRW